MCLKRLAAKVLRDALYENPIPLCPIFFTTTSHEKISVSALVRTDLANVGIEEANSKQVRNPLFLVGPRQSRAKN
jgi:hypothetical protein